MVAMAPMAAMVGLAVMAAQVDPAHHAGEFMVSRQVP